MAFAVRRAKPSIDGTLRSNVAATPLPTRGPLRDSEAEPLSPSDQPIVIGYDGSENSRRAIEHAAALLPGRRAKVVCLWHPLAGLMLRSDVEGLSGATREAADELDAADAQAGRRAAEEGAVLATDAGLEAEPYSGRIDGKLWATLLRLADEQRSAMVVAGQRGQSGVEAALLGSVSHGVLHHSERPVLIVPDSAPAGDPGPLLLCYDGSEASERAIAEAARQFPGQPAQVLTVWQQMRSVASAARIGAPDDVVEVAVEKIDGEAKRRGEATASEGVATARQAGFVDAEPMTRPSQGNVWSTIAHCDEARQASAIVVGSRGRSALRSALLGSVSRGVVTHSATPTLVVPPGPVI